MHVCLRRTMASWREACLGTCGLGARPPCVFVRRRVVPDSHITYAARPGMPHAGRARVLERASVGVSCVAWYSVNLCENAWS